MYFCKGLFVIQISCMLTGIYRTYIYFDVCTTKSIDLEFVNYLSIGTRRNTHNSKINNLINDMFKFNSDTLYCVKIHQSQMNYHTKDCCSLYRPRIPTTGIQKRDIWGDYTKKLYG